MLSPAVLGSWQRAVYAVSSQLARPLAIEGALEEGGGSADVGQGQYTPLIIGSVSAAGDCYLDFYELHDALRHMGVETNTSEANQIILK